VADEQIDLTALALELSMRGQVCIAWKSEDAGVAGVLACDNGKEVTNLCSAGDEYLLVPSQGVEQVLGATLGLTSEAGLAYPDLLLDGEVACFLIAPADGSVVALPADTVTKLLEDELDAEPVPPLDTA
jgi:hypothetical protein